MLHDRRAMEEKRRQERLRQAALAVAPRAEPVRPVPAPEPAYKPIPITLKDPEAKKRPPEREPRKAIGFRAMGMIIVPKCPHCGEKHRFRNAYFGMALTAHCGGIGGIVLEERTRE